MGDAGSLRVPRPRSLLRDTAKAQKHPTKVSKTITHVAPQAMGSLLSPGCGPVSLFDCVSFAHVLALPSRAVKTRALFMINVCLGIDP
jgi:hypothetical protein